MSHNHGSSAMDMDMGGMTMSAATPWNANLNYAIDWSIVMMVPIVLLTVRHGWLSARKQYLLRRSKRLVAPSGTSTRPSTINHNSHDSNKAQSQDISSSSPSTSNNPQYQPLNASLGSTATDTLPSDRLNNNIPRRWSYSRLENWFINKSSIAIYLGPLWGNESLVAGFTLLSLIFLSVLAVILLINGDLYLNSNRAGFLTLSCVPFLFAFTGKNSFVSWLTGISHHQLNRVHRYLGLAMFILASVHMGCMFHVWWPWTQLMAQQMATEKVRYGIATYSTLCLLVLTAAWPVRKYAYEFFVVSHSLFLIFLIMVGMHTPYAMRFTVAGIAFYLLNVLTGWCIKTRTGFATATVYGNDELTRLKIDQEFKGMKPGQHLYICIPAISWIQWHPFTVSGGACLDDYQSTKAQYSSIKNDEDDEHDSNEVEDEEEEYSQVESQDHQDHITMHAKAVGGFTRQLTKLWSGQDHDNHHQSERRVFLFGPYGTGVTIRDTSPYSKTIFLAAGSGMSFVMPILKDYLLTRGAIKTKEPIDLMWCLRDPDQVDWFRDELVTLLRLASGSTELEKTDTTALDLRISIHYTTSAYSPEPKSLGLEGAVPTPARASKSSLGMEDSTTIPSSRLPRQARSRSVFANDNRVQFVSGRVDFYDYIVKAIKSTDSKGELNIVACGPEQMLTLAHNAVAIHESLTSGCRVNLHTERFSL